MTSRGKLRTQESAAPSATDGMRVVDPGMAILVLGADRNDSEVGPNPIMEILERTPVIRRFEDVAAMMRHTENFGRQQLPFELLPGANGRVAADQDRRIPALHSQDRRTDIGRLPTLELRLHDGGVEGQHELDGPIIAFGNDQRAVKIAPGILDNDRRRLLPGPINRLFHQCAQSFVAVREHPSIEPDVQAIDRFSCLESTPQKSEHPTT